MSGRLLSFKDYLGGADNVQVIEMFPRNQKTFEYNYGGNDVSGYAFSADYQTIVLDTVSYDRITGDPNFADTNIIGYFGSATTIDANTYISTASASSGLVSFTIPEERYTGQITPNARDNVVMTVVSFQWVTDDAVPQKDMHRWAVIERWEPGVSPGDPTLANTFIRLGSGAISTFSDDSSTDVNRASGTYRVSGITNASSGGAGQQFTVDVEANTGVTSVSISNRGTGFVVGDTVTIYDTDLGNGGAADITITVNSIA